ncbi:MAG: DUF5666 domain-containing protein [Anaerolineae bacterium]
MSENEKLYDALEKCLQALEQGVDLDSALFPYPGLAAELRPLLQVALQAKTLSAVPSVEGMQRGRARLLQTAAQMRQAKATRSRLAQRRWWGTPALRRAAIALVLAVVFLLSGTGLVRASSTTLPGDRLYPVKRTWEGVRLLLVFNEEAREALEGKHEEERLHEILELLARGRESAVDFEGVFNDQTGQITVSGVPVRISAQTRLPPNPLTSGDAVRVIGRTTAQGFVWAEEIQLLPLGAVVPMGVSADQPSLTEKNGQGAVNESRRGNENESGTGPGSSSGNEAPQNQNQNANQNENQNEDGGTSTQRTPFKIKGVLESMNGNVWMVNQLTVYVADARIEGTPVPGAVVEIKGYFQPDGKFIATKVEVKSSSNDENKGKGGGGNDNRNENSNTNDNENKNENHNSNENHNDNEPED